MSPISSEEGESADVLSGLAIVADLFYLQCLRYTFNDTTKLRNIGDH